MKSSKKYSQFSCFIGRLIGWLWFDLLRIRRQIVIENIQRAFPDWDKDQVLTLARSSMYSLGKNIVDVFRLPAFDKKWAEENIEIEGLEHLKEAYSHGKGVFGLGLHLGSGDVGIACLHHFDIKVNLITKRFRTKWLNDYWFKVRQAHGVGLIEDRKSTVQIMRALKKNELIIFVLDQFMGPPLGVETQFFGQKTGAAMGLALLAGRTGAVVLPTYTYNRPDGKLINVFEKPIPFEEADTRDEAVKNMTQVYTDKIEEIVKKYPDQWLWVHRRWKEFKV